MRMWHSAGPRQGAGEHKKWRRKQPAGRPTRQPQGAAEGWAPLQQLQLRIPRVARIRTPEDRAIRGAIARQLAAAGGAAAAGLPKRASGIMSPIRGLPAYGKVRGAWQKKKRTRACAAAATLRPLRGRAGHVRARAGLCGAAAATQGDGGAHVRGVDQQRGNGCQPVASNERGARPWCNGFLGGRQRPQAARGARARRMLIRRACAASCAYAARWR